ncbi:7561_t:CDS:2, partial [Funneliformis geosporum]
LYNEFFDEVIPIDIQSIIMRESFGHPASFMIFGRIHRSIGTSITKDELNRSSTRSILVPITKDTDLRGAKVSFTSNVIFRVVFWEVGPKPRNSLQIQDVKDPIFLLAHTLQNVTSATIVNEQVRNLHGPSEKAFQAAALDLMVIQNNNNWCGYEFKVEKISSAQFRDP